MDALLENGLSDIRCCYHSNIYQNIIVIWCEYCVNLHKLTITETCEDDTVTVASTTYYMNNKTEDNSGGIYR